MIMIVINILIIEVFNNGWFMVILIGIAPSGFAKTHVEKCWKSPMIFHRYEGEFPMTNVSSNMGKSPNYQP